MKAFWMINIQFVFYFFGDSKNRNIFWFLTFDFNSIWIQYQIEKENTPKQCGICLISEKANVVFDWRIRAEKAVFCVAKKKKSFVENQNPNSNNNKSEDDFHFFFF